jgi:CDP-diacylglycerol--serine O-phosphatidyltransferase
MTNTTSDFGRELDSLADVVTFGMAPAILAYVWGVMSLQAPSQEMYAQLTGAGYFVAFFYLLCGAVRLARFNVTTNPIPKNPGRPDRKYFVGMPIPAPAAFVASVVYFTPTPIHEWMTSIIWMIVLTIAGLLMVSTWRYPSFKQLKISKPRSPLLVLIVGGFILLVVRWSQPVLLALASAYFVSGIIIRVGGIIRRYRRPSPPSPRPSEQLIG